MPVAVVTTVGAPGTPAPWSVTVTPGRTAPASSVTVPNTAPVVRCAAAGKAATSNTRRRPNPLTSQCLIVVSPSRELEKPEIEAYDWLHNAVNQSAAGFGQ